ncbi:MAG: hypothetical protein WAT19_15830 [Ferruginibacter sp.]
MSQIFKTIISDFISTQNNGSMMSLVNYVRKKKVSDYEIADLAISLSKTGEIIKTDKTLDLYDIPSTGGPSSLSTLLGPLFLRCLNKKVLKIGVPGRPAGGVDTLAQINGYNVNINPDIVNEKLMLFGYIHLLTNSSFVPLDGKFFKFRKENQAVAIPSLVIASILAKKIAAGIKNIGLDIRVSNFGNFGNSWEEARINANRFISVAALIGIKCTCFLSNGYTPQQPYIGRGESLLALQKIFQEKMNSSLERHFGFCGSMAKSLVHEPSKVIGIKDIKNAFFENLRCQQGDKNHFYSIVTQIETTHINKITAKKNGYIKIDLEQIRKSIIAIQENYTQIFPDPCGIILLKLDGDQVFKGTQLCSFRCPAKFRDNFKVEMEKAFSISAFYEQPYELEIVN